MKKKKTFDCVEMKNKIQEQILKETEGMTQDELLAYYNRHSVEFKQQQKECQAKKKVNK
jgi:hypothetical protein